MEWCYIGNVERNYVVKRLFKAMWYKKGWSSQDNMEETKEMNEKCRENVFSDGSTHESFLSGISKM